VGVDAEGRPYNLKTIVVNFANVGAAYAKKVLKRTPHSGDQMLFDWEGVRRCVMYLTQKGLKVVGVIFENFWATDNDSPNKKEIPVDIRNACESIEETPRLVGKNHRSADDEMTIKCAYHRIGLLLVNLGFWISRFSEFRFSRFCVFAKYVWNICW